MSSAGLPAEAPELTPSAQLVACTSGTVERKRIVLEGTAPENAVRLVEALTQEGVL